MSGTYVAAVDRLGWLMDALEARLEGLTDGTVLDTQSARAVRVGFRPTMDETAAAFGALEQLGVLTPVPAGHVFNRERWKATEPYRAGVRHGLVRGRATPETVRLCAALPAGLARTVEEAMRSWTLDLRGAVVDLAAAAQHDLVLASPFWDAATVDDIGPVLEGRLDAGVRVRLLGRFERGIGADVRNAIAPLIAHPACKLLGWFEPSEGDPFGARTFHFKAAIADGGARGYLGTANFTESGLRSRLELGVLLEGETARRLADVVDAVLSLAHPINPMNS